MLLARLLLLILFAACCWLPAWWFAGRIDPAARGSLVRLPLSIGLALAAYVTVVNLLGRLFDHSIAAVLVHVGLHAVACGVLLWRARPQLEIGQLWIARRAWYLPLLLALILAVPQLFQAISGNRWDEIASSAIHVTAPNQFAEGVFPPRHNAFPDIPIRYHYGFVVLSGTVRWVTGLSANTSIDVASTGLWLFAFVFVFSWLHHMRLKRIAAYWGSFSMLLGGGLSWLYLRRLEIYEGFRKIPLPESRTHAYDPETGWFANLIEVMRNQNVHLRGGDGALFPLPFDVAIHFQQHAVALGIALTLIAAYLFWLWQTRDDFAPLLTACCVLGFGLVFLGHAVFGGVASISAGLVLMARWLRRPSVPRILQGVVLTVGVTGVAFLHGGMLTRGPEYGSGTVLKLRGEGGYLSGGILDHVNWGLAGFGVPLVFALVAVGYWLRTRRSAPAQHAVFLGFFGAFGLVSFMIPQVFFFSHSPSVEQQTEISKFFFCTHLSIALVSAFGAGWLAVRLGRWPLILCFAMTIVTPLAVCYAGATNPDGSWIGFYESPYAWSGGRNHLEMGKALHRLKKGNRDVYYDFSTVERRSAYINELLVYGGSVFSLTPTRYEVTGLGYLLDEERVGQRILQEAGVARLLPGAAERSSCDWLYSVPGNDVTRRPPIVRSRFAKMVAEGMLSEKFATAGRALYAFEGTTLDLDRGIERYWAPRIVAPAHSDWDGDGRGDLLFLDYMNRAILIGDERIALPSIPGHPPAEEEFPLLFLASFPGDRRVDVVLGRMSDPVYRTGETVEKMIRQYPYFWRRWDSAAEHWEDGYQHGFWGSPLDVPLIADIDNDGFDSQLVYRPLDGRWFEYSKGQIDGPSLPDNSNPLPLAGRFLPGSNADLALWSPTTGKLVVRSIQDGRTESIDWGGRPGDVLLPGDYDGDGRDEIGIWQPHTNTWWVRTMPDGPNRRSGFGTATGIPLPADYDDDGRLDLAYWEPAEQKIYISFDFGESVGRTVTVPPHSIPAFVNMY
jgi:hypothetical protein